MVLIRAFLGIATLAARGAIALPKWRRTFLPEPSPSLGSVLGE